MATKARTPSSGSSGTPAKGQGVSKAPAAKGPAKGPAAKEQTSPARASGRRIGDRVAGLFRRRRASASAEPEVVPKVGGKGRPTRSRKEAEATQRVGLGGVSRTPTNRKEANAQRREQQQLRYQALQTGDEAHLPPQDKGKDRRLVRDYVDARFNVAEFSVFLFIVLLALLYIGRSVPRLQAVGNIVFFILLLVIVVDFGLLQFKVKRLVAQRFPDEVGRRGTAFYAIRRAMQLRRLRLPKPQVKRGAKV